MYVDVEKHYHSLMIIGDVVKQLGIPASTLRYYERKGLIKPQARISGRRQFDEATLLRLRFIQLAQTTGFSLDEIKRLLSSFIEGTPDTGNQCQNFARKKQLEIRQQIEDLQHMDLMLTQLTGCGCISIESCVRQNADRFNKIENDG